MPEYSPVPELNKLHALETAADGEFLATGFELFEFGDAKHDGYSDDPEFLKAFTCFAYATGSGSVYAFWHLDNRPDFATLPIVAFGDEGGVCITALHLHDLLRQLACDRELSVDWGGASFWEYDPEYRDSVESVRAQETYVAWVQRELDLTVPADPDALITAAETIHGQGFKSWVAPYLPS